MLVIILFFSVWKIMESTYFSDFISERFLDTVVEKLDMEISFEQIKIKIVPLSVELKNISFQKTKDQDFYEGRFDSFSIEFGFLDLITRNKINIESIRLEKGLASFSSSNSADQKEYIFSDELKNILSFQDAFPNFVYGKNVISIFGLSFNDVDIKFNDNYAYLKKADLWRSRKGWHLNFNINSIQSDAIRYDFNQIDRLSANLSLVDDGIKISNLVLDKKLDRLELSGDLKLLDKNLFVELNTKFKGDLLEGLREQFPKVDLLKRMDAYSDIESKIILKEDKWSAEGKARFEEFETPYANGNRLEVGFNYSNEKVVIKEAHYENNQGSAKVNSSFELYDVKNNKFLVNVINVNTEKLDLLDALYSVPTLRPLRGRLSGNIDVIISNEKVVFYGQDGLRLEAFELDFEKKYPLLKINALSLKKCEISLLLPNNDILLDLGILFPNSVVLAKGSITQSGFNIQTDESFIDLDSLGPISGTQLGGSGFIDLKVTGKEKVILDFKFKPVDFTLLGFHFGEVDSSFSIDPSEGFLDISRFNSQYGVSKISGTGNVDFSDDINLNLDMRLDGATTNDSKNIFKLFFSEKDWLPKDFYMMYDARFKVMGRVARDELFIEGNLSSNNLSYLKEEFDTTNLKFTYTSNVLNLTDLNLNKNKGVLKGEYQHNFNTENIKLNLNFNNWELAESKYYAALNLGLNGQINGGFKAEGKVNELNGDAFFEIKDTTVADLNLPNSTLNLSLRDQKLSGNFRLLGTVGIGQILLNFNKNIKDRSEFNFEINSRDLGILAGILSEHNLTEKDVNGQMNIKMTGDMNLFDLRDINLELLIDRFNFSKSDLIYSVVPQKNKIFIQDGSVSDWNIEVTGRDQYFSGQGFGGLREGIRIENSFMFDGSLFELIGPSFKKVRGLISGKANFYGDYKKINPEIIIQGEQINVNSAYVPGVFEGINFKSSLNSNEVIIHDVNGKYNGGDFSADGIILLRIPFPAIKINYILNNTKIAVMKRSNFVLSGSGKFEGTQAPYELYGDLYIPFGNINDTLNEILKKRVVSDDFTVFLPGRKNLDKIELIKLNINLDITKPIVIRNNISELSFRGKLNIFGYPANPLVKGQLNFSPQASKFIFKGNEFILNEGRINFLENEAKIDPEFSFLGVSKINEYEIRIAAKGRGRDLDFKLSSEPSLSQEDILSLLTLGVTSQASKSLQAKDRESLTSIGIGSLIMDQFQINEGLNSTLGLRLSVTPEFADETEIDPLSGRTSGAGGTTSRVRSATRIKVKKKITNKLDMSLSSTVGGSIEQKQEMNLDYNINKNILLQGIYEIKSSNEQESSEDPTSIGADLKFRWFFK